MGFGRQELNYFHRCFKLDSLGNYSPFNSVNNSLIKTNGQKISNYFFTGIDVSFGMDIFLSNSFLITLQVTPQFNYYVFNSNKKLEDPLGEYTYDLSYSDFKLGYFDVYLIYKF